MTTNEPLSPAARALVALRGLIYNSDDVTDLITARLDDDFDAIDAIDDRPETFALLDTIVSDPAFALAVINDPDA